MLSHVFDFNDRFRLMEREMDRLFYQPKGRSQGAFLTLRDAGKELVLTPANVRRVVPDRILGVRVLPLVDRTVVVAGNKLGNIGFWDADGMVEDEGDDDADGLFEYLPHRGPVPAIVAHPGVPHKVMVPCYPAILLLY
jgi:hypothetical protein